MNEKKRFLHLRSITVTLCAFIVAAVVLFSLTQRVSESVEAKSTRIAYQAIMRALITCYAAEGSFPASISHLEEHYGVVIDHDRYIVIYDIFASNVMPRVTLKRRR